MASFQKKGKTTHPTVLTQCWQGLHSVIYHHIPEPGPTCTHLEDNLLLCFEDQTKIEWNHFALGRIAKSWGYMNRKLLKERNNIEGEENMNIQDDITWTTKISREIINFTLSIWQTRNNLEHGDNTQTTSIFEREEALEKIELYYKYVRPLILSQDEWLFQQSERRKVSESYQNQLAWIATVERLCGNIIKAQNLSTSRYEITGESMVY